MRLVKEIDHESVGATVDVGHQKNYAELTARVQPEEKGTPAGIRAYNDVTHMIIDELGSKIFHMHVHDIEPRHLGRAQTLGPRLRRLSTAHQEAACDRLRRPLGLRDRGSCRGVGRILPRREGEAGKLSRREPVSPGSDRHPGPSKRPLPFQAPHPCGSRIPDHRGPAPDWRVGSVGLVQPLDPARSRGCEFPAHRADRCGPGNEFQPRRPVQCTCPRASPLRAACRSETAGSATRRTAPPPSRRAMACVQGSSRCASRSALGIRRRQCGLESARQPRILLRRSNDNR